MNIMPNITTTNEIQRSYRKVFEMAKKNGPVVVMTNNKPDVVILSPSEYDKLYLTQQQWEMKDTLKAIKAYKKDKAAGKLIKLNSLADLL